MRFALAVIVVTAGVGVVLHDHRSHRNTFSLAASPRDTAWPVRATRSYQRPPLPHVKAVTPPTVKTRWQRWDDITAYCETGSRTASGVWPHTGMAATLDRSIPFGTKLQVGRLGTFTVADRIGYGSDVDLYFGDQSDCERRALDFGRRHLLVTTVSE